MESDEGSRRKQARLQKCTKENSDGAPSCSHALVYPTLAPYYSSWCHFSWNLLVCIAAGVEYLLLSPLGVWQRWERNSRGCHFGTWRNVGSVTRLSLQYCVFNNVFESGTHPSPDSCHTLCWIRWPRLLYCRCEDGQCLLCHHLAISLQACKEYQVIAVQTWRLSWLAWPWLSRSPGQDGDFPCYSSGLWAALGFSLLWMCAFTAVHSLQWKVSHFPIKIVWIAIPLALVAKVFFFLVSFDLAITTSETNVS